MIQEQFREFFDPPTIMSEADLVGSVCLIQSLEFKGDIPSLMHFKNNLKDKHGAKADDVENIRALIARAINSEPIL